MSDDVCDPGSGILVYTLTIMGLSESFDMAVIRVAISRILSETEEAAEIPPKAASLLHIYRDLAEKQLDTMDTAARSRAMVGYMLLKADAYRQGGWLQSWREVLDEAEEQAHLIKVREEFLRNLDLLWRNAMLLILYQITSSVVGEGLHEGGSGSPVRVDLPGEITGLNDEDLMGAVQTALYEAEIEDPDDFLTQRGLM